MKRTHPMRTSRTFVTFAITLLVATSTSILADDTVTLVPPDQVQQLIRSINRDPVTPKLVEGLVESPRKIGYAAANPQNRS